MTNSKLLPIGALAILLVGAGSLFAAAQTAPVDPAEPAAQAPERRLEDRGDHGRPGDRMARGDHGPRGPHGPHGGPGFGGRGASEMMQTLFTEVDADGDGSVTQAEIDAFRTAKVGAADASGDGALSIEEFDTLYREFTRSRMVDMFQDFDANGDGNIDPAEMEARVGRIVERMDRDGDGALTLQDRGHRG